MQGLGGCRAVLHTVEQVRILAELYRDGGRLKHKLRGRGADYISTPKQDGYRSEHLVYEYHPHGAGQERWAGLPIEIQIRTSFQHAWAAAVETVDLFTGSGLKTGGPKDPNWGRLFTSMSSELAMIEEAPPVPGTPEDPDERARELADLEHRTQACTSFELWRHTQENVIGRFKRGFVLIKTDPERSAVFTSPIPDKLGEARAAELYSEAEKNLEGKQQVVLVKVQSAANLTAACLSWFADTGQFLEVLDGALRRVRRSGCQS